MKLRIGGVQQPEIYLSQVDRLFDDESRLREGPVRDLLLEFTRAFHAWSVLVGQRSSDAAAG